MQNPRVIVEPAGALDQRPRLFAALAALFGVDFVGAGDAALAQAAIFLDGAELPTGAHNFSRTVTYRGNGSSRAGGVLRTLADGPLDPRLTGIELTERSTLTVVDLAPAERPIATAADGSTFWATGGGAGRHDIVGTELVDLGPAERLRWRLADGHWLAMLPLFELLRDITQYVEWSRPAPTATFIVDDPNLHATTYGWLNFRALDESMRRTGAHMSVSMVPLDSWYANRSVLALFRESPHLSLSVHGNNHLRRELAESDAQRCNAIAVSARRRMRRFAERCNIDVDPVMVPPHGACSEQMMQALAGAGFAGVSYTGPVGAHDDPALVGIRPVDVHLGGGLPGIHRSHYVTPEAELRFRRYLDQPLVLYGHHEEFRGGMGLVEAAVERVTSIGETRWAGLGDVLKSTSRVRISGAELVVELAGVAAALDVPAGVESVRVVPVTSTHRTGPVTVTLAGTDSAIAPFGTAHAVRGPGRLALHVQTAPGQSPPRESPTALAWPVLRRLLCEVRDRTRVAAGTD